MAAVSVVIPTYNHARYLPDAVNSVLAQSFTDWEALIVDDGSTDNTQSVAAQFTDPRIRYLHQANRGLSGARNTGIAAAQGELIALLDADDLWAPEFLARMVDELGNRPHAAAAYCGFRWMDAGGSPLNQSVLEVVPPEQFREVLLYQGSWLSACAVVARAAGYRSVGPFDESLRACEDYDMWLRMSATMQFVGVPEVLVYYRRAGNNMSDDVERMGIAMSTVLHRHLGIASVPEQEWSPAQISAIKQVYLMRAQECLAIGKTEQSAEAIQWLATNQPHIACSLDMWYALACVHQPRGQRGDKVGWNQEYAQRDLIAVLEELTRKRIPPRQVHKMHGLAHFSLALLHYQQQQISDTRRELLMSYRSAPLLFARQSRTILALKSLPVIRRLRKLSNKADSDKSLKFRATLQ